MRCAERDAVLFRLAGGFELAPGNGEGWPENAPAPGVLVAAYETLGYDAGQLTAVESARLSKAGVRPPRNWLPADTLRVQGLPLPGGGAVAVLLLPELSPPAAEEELLARAAKAVDKAVREAQRTARLVIAVSPWGMAAEQTFLERQERAKAALPDILLGAGPGPGFAGRIAAGGRTLWLRAAGRGRAVNRVDVLAWPERAKGFAWGEGVNIVFGLQGLDESIADDDAVARLLDAAAEASQIQAQGGHDAVPRRVYRVGDPFQERSR